MAGVKTPIKSIREYCIGCSGGSKGEVRLCPVIDCPLYPYRMGHRPKNEENNKIDTSLKNDSLSNDFEDEDFE